MKLRHMQLLFFALLTLLLNACATHVVKSTTYTPVVQDGEFIPENLLLDVGIAMFDAGLDEIDNSDEETTNGQIRVAESRYVPYLLSETLQRSGNWGIVRAMPNDESPMDIYVTGTILESNGEAMTVRVKVSDSTGKEWYTREYDEVISQFSYDPSERNKNDPFQVIYNKIANDLLTYRQEELNANEISNIRSISQLRFAQRFAPDVFDSYLSQNRWGMYQVERLPAVNDPLIERIAEIRERDFMFIDTVQDYYATYTRQMRIPYDTWRELSYHETVTLRELRNSAKRRFISGTAVVLGSIAAATSGNYVAQTGGLVGVGAGAYLIKSGFDKQSEAKIHIEALEELGQSLEDELAPRVINLEDRTITLTGTVEEQYSQWREILADLYAAEIGSL